MGLAELMLINTGIFGLILVVMLIFLTVGPRDKHSKKKVKEDLKNIKDQINGDA
tara:strand:- start:226 stop:387 length:162 start_codon:yes stop_codon:yes gene_type:complete